MHRDTYSINTMYNNTLPTGLLTKTCKCACSRTTEVIGYQFTIVPRLLQPVEKVWSIMTHEYIYAN